MSAANHPTCYGKFFPASFHGESKGKAFSLQYVTPVGMMPRHPQPTLDPNAWDECTKCPDFENCYKLSMAKLAMTQACATL